MSSNFIHLHAHSEYSLDVGFSSISDYVKLCHENKFKSAVITERFNLYSSIKFYKECINFGIKPIIGCEFLLEYNQLENSKIIILCKNNEGYKNLSILISLAQTNNLINGIPILKYEWLLNLNEGLIVIGLSFESDVGLSLINDEIKTSIEKIKFWKKILKNNYYLSISKLGIPAEYLYLERLFNLKIFKNIQVVAINEVCYLREKDFLAYKSKIAIFDKEKRTLLNIEDNYFKNKFFKTEKNMLDLFKNEKESLYNTLELSKRCNFKFNFKNDYSPKYLKKKHISNAELLIKISFEELKKKLLTIKKKLWNQYIIRLNNEVSIINNVGFENYFLITHDFILWAKKNEIYVGPGRGSCSGSLVAYFLKITQIDPIRYNLLFERFLNKERLSKPDFDIDFCIESRDLVINYIYEEYGIENVAQIITFGCMTIKAVIKDIGRVLGYAYTFTDKIAKLISNDFGISLKSEIIHNIKLKNEYNSSYDLQNIINLSLKIEGIIKNVGKHAGGLIISPIKLLNHIPLSLEEENNSMTQFDKNDSEELGFSKFDFLGLKNLSVISHILESIMAYNNFLNKKINFEIEELLPEEKNTFILLQSADTTGIFQLESFGIKSVLQKIKPNSILDISALIALYRPGPLQSGMLNSFVKRKIGIEKIEYMHERVKKVLEETYGMIIYQEQVMLIAQVFAGYDLSLADFLRIAMSKKNNQEMLNHLEYFSKGASIYNIDKKTSENVFYLLEKFAGYGFNKAHSVGYSYLTYNLAWLKANYNTIFITTLISSDMYNQNNLNLFINDAKHFNIKILNPDINRSFYNFTIFNKNSIRYGLGGIKNLGSIIISDILLNRSIFGHFESFFDFLNRIEIENLTKKTLQNLVYSGLFDKLNCFRFKLILITSKVFDIFFKTNKSILYFNTIDDYFNKIKKSLNYIKSYKQNENKAITEVFPKNFQSINIEFYKHESLAISKLSYKTGNYFNKFILALIKEIEIKNKFNKKTVIIKTKTLKKEYEIYISYERYLFLKDLIIQNKLVVICYYCDKNIFKELIIEDFYIFRLNFLKSLEITLTKNFIKEKFIKNFVIKTKTQLIKGKTKLIFKIKSKKKYKIINLNLNEKIAIHDNIINNLNMFKEIKNLEFIYKI